MESNAFQPSFVFGNGLRLYTCSYMTVNPVCPVMLK